MKVSEYIRRKNDIIEKATGFVLVPEDQIIELEPMPLRDDNDIWACPYCILFYDNKCEKCPMHLANNDCVNDKYSTYHLVIDYLGGSILTGEVEREIVYLIDEYNESNGF